jgi:hypothetical protein
MQAPDTPRGRLLARIEEFTSILAILRRKGQQGETRKARRKRDNSGRQLTFRTSP